MAETAVPSTPVVEGGVARTNHNAHTHSFQVNYTCALKRTANLTLTNETYVNITFPTGSAEEVSDPLNWHSLSTNSERITVTKSGLYLIQFLFHIYDDYLQGIDFYVELRKNGSSTEFTVSGQYPNARNYLFSGSAFLNLSDGDYINFRIYHEGGAYDLQLIANQALFSATLLR